jgi:hypothetical protein
MQGHALPQKVFEIKKKGLGLSQISKSRQVLVLVSIENVYHDESWSWYQMEN